MPAANPPMPASARHHPPIALTVAGLDPSCGAGLTADLKTFAAHRLYGVCCATAMTVQSTLGVEQVAPLDPALVAATLRCLVSDLPPAGIKIGMMATAAIAQVLADFLNASALPRHAIVLDPVLSSSSGSSLLKEAGLAILREQLLPVIGWITPNLDELAVLTGEPVAARADVPAQARRLQQMAGRPGLRVVVTGGHLAQPDDYFLEAGGEGAWFTGERVETTATHGTGCAFSSALLCQVLAGAQGGAAVSGAKAYVTAALRNAYPLGQGKGPMHHLFQY